MNSIICNYDLEFIHPNRSSLVRLVKNYNDSVSISFGDSPKKLEDSYGYYISARISCEETGEFIFTDILKKLLNKVHLLEVGGSFIDNIGRGYVNSLCHKDYTKTY